MPTFNHCSCIWTLLYNRLWIFPPKSCPTQRKTNGKAKREPKFTNNNKGKDGIKPQLRSTKITGRKKYIYIWSYMTVFSSVQLSHSVMSNSLWPHEPQHARPPCPSPTPGVYPNSCPLSQWCHPIISSSVVPFSSCPQFFPASGSFPVSQLFASWGQSIGVSASTSVLPMNSQDWSPLGWTGWISLQSKGLSRVFSNTTVQKASILWCSAFFLVQLSHPYMTTGKTIALTRQTFVNKVMSLLFNMLS